MTDREKLIALMIEAKKADTEDVPFSEFLADFLIANGVTFATDKNDGAKMEGWGMYKSPIEIVYGGLQTQLEGEILRAVQKVDVVVDKDDLIRALAYDRDQYEKGFRDGVASVQQKPRPLDDWGEDYGDVLWWVFPIEEPPYVGSPLDEKWPGYHTHWTPIIVPEPPKEE